MRKCVILLLLLVSASIADAQKRRFPETLVGKILFEQTGEKEYSFRLADPADTSGVHDNTRLIAILLDVSLGLFGVHRLYLGTDVKVPVFYTLTIGGGGILWLIDLGLILFSKDLEPFIDNPHIFMWVEE